MFTVASYNILADAYAKPDRYPRTPAALLVGGARTPAIADTIALLDADVVCLQEVERATFEQLSAQLGALGYAGRLMLKTGGRPDGCATFTRNPVAVTGTHEHAYSDGSGHIALVVIADIEGTTTAVANTHLKWSPADADPDEQWAIRQISEIAAELDVVAASCDARIVCGDFNALANSEVARAIESAGYTAALGSLESAHTCNAHGRARKIDFIFHTDALRAFPRPPAALTDDTPMPSEAHPSDHLPIRSGFEYL